MRCGMSYRQNDRGPQCSSGPQFVLLQVALLQCEGVGVLRWVYAVAVSVFQQGGVGNPAGKVCCR